MYLAFLYQRFFLYPIDSTRVNEYGYCPQAAAEATANDGQGVAKDLANGTEPGKELNPPGDGEKEGAKADGNEDKKDK